MGNLFNPDNKFMQLGAKLFDLMLLQLATLFLCLPVFTAGAAFTAMHNVLLKIYRDEYSSVLREFWAALKANFKQSTILWLFLLSGILFLYINFRLIAITEIAWIKPGLYLLAVPAIYLLLAAGWIFVLQSRYDNPVTKTLRNAFLMVLMRPFASIINALLLLLPIVALSLAWQVIPFLFFLGFTLPGILRAILYSRIFDSLEGTNWRKDQAEGKIYNI